MLMPDKLPQLLKGSTKDRHTPRKAILEVMQYIDCISLLFFLCANRVFFMVQYVSAPLLESFLDSSPLYYTSKQIVRCSISKGLG